MSKIVISGGTETLTWEQVTWSLDSVEVQRDATLVVDKYIFDTLITLPEFRSDGVVEVTANKWNLPDNGDLNALIQRNTVRTVNFQSALQDLHSLTFQANSTLAVGFQGGMGTTKNDKITVKKNAVITLGTSGFTLDFDIGKNTVAVQSNADFTMNCALQNITKITVDNGKAIRINGEKCQLHTVAKFADVTFQEALQGTIRIGNFASASFGNITGGIPKNTFTVGHDSAVTFGDCSGIYGAFRLTLGADSTLTGNKLVMNYGKDQVTVGTGAYLALQSMEFGYCNDKLTIGKWATVTLENLLMGSDENKIVVGDYATLDVSGETDFSYDSVKIGKYATVTLKMDGFTWYTPLPYNPVDPIIIIDDPYPIHILDDDSNSSAMWYQPIGKYIYPVRSIVSLKNFTLGEGATAYLSSELARAVTKKHETAKVYDIGVYETALNFTNISDEKSDNALTKARAVSGEYNGWLSGEYDRIDFLQIGDATSLTWDAADGLELKLYDADGVSATITESTVDVTGYAAFSLEIKNTEPVKQCYKYTVTLA